MKEEIYHNPPWIITIQFDSNYTQLIKLITYLDHLPIHHTRLKRTTPKLKSPQIFANQALYSCPKIENSNLRELPIYIQGKWWRRREIWRRGRKERVAGDGEEEKMWKKEMFCGFWKEESWWFMQLTRVSWVVSVDWRFIKSQVWVLKVVFGLERFLIGSRTWVMDRTSVYGPKKGLGSHTRGPLFVSDC